MTPISPSDSTFLMPQVAKLMTNGEDQEGFQKVIDKANQLLSAYPNHKLFFHGQPAADILLAYLIKELHRAQGHPCPKHYQYLRPPRPSNLTHKAWANTLHAGDRHPDAAAAMVSVTSLGNIAKGECAWSYFYQQRCNWPEGRDAIFRQIIQAFSLDPKPELIARLNALAGQMPGLLYGNMHIIAIPSYSGCERIQACGPAGLRRCDVNLEEYSDLLEWKWSHVQFRIFPDQLPPESGMHVHIVSSLTKEERTELKKQVRDIAQELLRQKGLMWRITSWFKRVAKH